MKPISFLLFFVVVSVFINCNTPDSEAHSKEKTTSPAISSKPEPIVKQLIIATNKLLTDQTGELIGVEWQAGKWDTTFEVVSCSFGKNGIAKFNKKREGDGKSPSGNFGLGAAFGYTNDLNAAIDFIELTDNHYWVSDTASAQYNQMVEAFPEGVYAEKMRRKDHLYKYGLIIEYNTKEVVKNNGSAIFVHVERRKGAPTAGCVAISEAKMKALIEWLKPDLNPHIRIYSISEKADKGGESMK